MGLREPRQCLTSGSIIALGMLPIKVSRVRFINFILEVPNSLHRRGTASGRLGRKDRSKR